jgi:hypothetical protein
MLVQIHKFVAKSYGELMKENFEKILADLVLFLMIISCMLAADSLLKDITVTLFDVIYKLDILVSYLLGFVFILTTSSLFKEMRTLLNVVSRFIITRFPRMHGNFTPVKAILRDLVQVILLMLIFYPVSDFVENISYKGFLIPYAVSLSFLLLTLIFAYDITSNAIRILSKQTQKLASGLFLSRAVPEKVI